MQLSLFSFLLLSLLLLSTINADTLPLSGFRPPAVPLINWDPYMNIYSFADELTDMWPSLWTGSTKAFTGLIRIDGDAYRFMGPEVQDGGTMPVKMDQISVTVQTFPFTRLCHCC